MSFYNHLDLPTLLELLRQQRQNGVLSSPHVHLRGKKKCHAVLLLVSGSVTSCTIKDNSETMVAEGEKALQLLSQAEPIEWEWKPQRMSIQEHSIQNTSIPVQEDDLVPYRVRHLGAHETFSWPRSHRQVFALVDEQRSVSAIASLLAVSWENTFQVLRDLQEHGFVTLRRKHTSKNL